MKIVVLDGYTLNPGDLSWDGLEALGECVVYDRTPPQEVLARSKGAAILLTNKVVLDRDTMAQLPELKYIGVLATGYNIVDVEAARKRGVVVTNVPAYSTNSVVQMTFAHLLNLCLYVGQHSESVRSGNWSRSPDFSYWEYPLVELAGLTMGVVGFGRIGRGVAKAASAFGMEVLVCDPFVDAASIEGVVAVDLETLFTKSDVVSLHCPLTEQNRGFVNARLLSLMKKNAFLINTSRGLVIDEEELAEALNQEKIAGAGVDVLVQEPPSAESPLLKAKNCFLTPHIAWATGAARVRLLHAVVENVKAFLRGEALNVVNPA